MTMRHAGILLIGLLILSVSAVAQTGTTLPTTRRSGKSYRLVCVSIPADSRHRKDPALGNPPNVFIIVKKDGERIAKSTDVAGWELDYPRRENNHCFIDDDPSARYSIEVWASGRMTDQMILSVIGLGADDFRHPIKERLASVDDPERAATITFQAERGPRLTPADKGAKAK